MEGWVEQLPSHTLGLAYDVFIKDVISIFTDLDMTIVDEKSIKSLKD